MQKLVLAALAIALGLGFFFVAGQPFGKKENPTLSLAEPLCGQFNPSDIDFSVLNDIRDIIMQYSVFYAKNRPDQAQVLNRSLPVIFGTFGVPEEEIPAWAWDMVKEASRKGIEADFAVIQRIYERLRDDPEYQQLPAYNRLNSPTFARQFFDSAITGIVKRGLVDPFAAYMDPEAYQSGDDMVSGKYSGVGIRHDVRENKFIVTKVFPGEPAEKAGVRPGDELLAVDGKFVAGCSSRAFGMKVRGKPGTAVVLRVRRMNGGEEDIKIIRDTIRTPSVLSCPGVFLPQDRGKSDKDLAIDCPLLGKKGEQIKDIAYVKVKIFSAEMPKDLMAVLFGLDPKKYKGIIIDWRGNPGGSVRALGEALDYFFEDIVFKTTEYYNGAKEELRHERYNIAVDASLIVLVGPDPNETGPQNNSYSAAEAFAGIMQDLRRAGIIGEQRTGGKGTTNLEIPIRDGKSGALYLAIGLWYTPSGRSVQGEDLDGDGYEDTGGITPDIVVRWSDEDYAKRNQDATWDPILQRAIDEFAR